MTKSRQSVSREEFELIQGAELSALNTLRVCSTADWLAAVQDTASLPRVFALPQAQAGNVFVLGGGSNVLFTSDYPGLIIRIMEPGIKFVGQHGGDSFVRVAAGESWDGFVRWSLDQRLAGLENLIFIPGTVGAAPVQNIGAYGVEVCEFIEQVDAYDRQTGVFQQFTNEACSFSYRDSLFKRQPERYVITAVTFRLSKQRGLRLDYVGIKDELAAMEIHKPGHIDVARAVERLRRRKLPDPAEIGNAGSFFKNPVVSAEQFLELRGQYPEMPAYRLEDGGYKLAAAWMIEHCGLKGHRDHDAGISRKHALVLVNYGHATGEQLLELAMQVQQEVKEVFDILLAPEPVLL